MSDGHLTRVRAEFERQSATFDAYAAQPGMDMGERFCCALGDAGRGDVLDVACGPGTLAVAVARDAARVVGLDATGAMLDRARRRADAASLHKVSFVEGDAENLPFDDGTFDAVVNRASLHHFLDPGRAIAEMARVLKPGGRAVIVDVVSSDVAAEAELHNALETLRDPSHTRMLSPAALDGLVAAAGLRNLAYQTWDMAREFDEWAAIANDPDRVDPLRIVTRSLAASGHRAGIDLRLADGRIRFLHRWRLVAADKP